MNQGTSATMAAAKVIAIASSMSMALSASALAADGYGGKDGLGTVAPSSTPGTVTLDTTCARKRVGIAAVWQVYVEGLRRGDLDALRQIFHAAGTFHIAGDGSGDGLIAQRFSEALPAWAARPDPSAQGRLTRVGVQDRMGVIEGRLRFAGRTYRDVLTLYCLDDRWVVVGKITYVESSTGDQR